MFMIITFCKIIAPSGKRLHNYGKSPFFMGKSTISTGPFSIVFCMFTRPGQLNCLGVNPRFSAPVNLGHQVEGTRRCCVITYIWGVP